MVTVTTPKNISVTYTIAAGLFMASVSLNFLFSLNPTLTVEIMGMVESHIKNECHHVIQIFIYSH